MGKFIDLTGQKFGRLTVLSRAEGRVEPSGKKRTRWACRCDCGNTCVVLGEALTRGATMSCGCLQKERASIANTKHGKTNSRLYGVWCSMKSRCNNSSSPEYSLYGGRGVRVCPEWESSYSAFAEWAHTNGYIDDALRGQCTIDRIDTDGDYSPDNCRIATQKEQMNNVRYNHIVQYGDQNYTIAQLADITGISYATLLQRINRYNYTVEAAVTKPVKRRQ